MRARFRRQGLWCAASLAIVVTSLLLSLCSNRAFAYSALTHEAIIDAAWDGGIAPLLRERFAGISEDELREARAYAYGGCIVQDMGYYPFGSMLFTDLVHYVRSGDFVEALLEEAQPLEEYAFALGALEHYFGDAIGHTRGVNPAVGITYPKLRQRYGPLVTWADQPTAHMRVEFGFDVLQVARGRYSLEAHSAFIGFKVATSLLIRAFFKTYGLDLRSLLTNVDLSIGTYRHTVSEVIPAATAIAWDMKKDDFERRIPGLRRDQFVYTPCRAPATRNNGESSTSGQDGSPQ